MNVADLTQLLAGTSITTLTLRTPTETITLHRHPNSSLPGSTRQPSPSSTPLSAPCSGLFLHHHPLRATPLAQIGQGVQTGAVLGLLQVGPLLLHITAPRAGTVASIGPEAIVGYGTPLVHLAAEENECKST